MVVQSVVVIKDSCREFNSKVFHWAPNGLSLVAGDNLTLVVVLHQVITPLGCKISVDSRLAFGANQKIIEAEVARKKNEYKKNEELAHIFKLYKSIKVGFSIEIAMGSSPKTVALKSATKLKATWLILDRKMKNDEEYFLKKLSCGLSRVRSSNRIVRIRGPIDRPQQKQSYRSSETYGDSLPPYEFSIDSEFFTIENFSNNRVNYGMYHGQEQRQKKNFEENKHNEQERVIKQKEEFQEKNNKIQEHESERYLYFGGARNFFLGGAENYTISEHSFQV
ncbi:unnamed protein product [Vicia faba]|uniref:Uncharacterized protein n=1 Tax=Vicia faba TaxID=3906 RepID=A0AAV0YN24_VICFA|nr:unnamed protein product [Vicia faba]